MKILYKITIMLTVLCYVAVVAHMLTGRPATLAACCIFGSGVLLCALTGLSMTKFWRPK